MAEAAVLAGGGTSRSLRFAEALQLQNEGRYHRAAAIYHELVQIEPADPSVFNNLGNCLRSLGEFEKAIQCFDHALRLEPGRGSSRLNRSLALLALGRYEEAWEDYEARLDLIDFRRELQEAPQRKWSGQPLEEHETLYLFGNQGLGDEIQCFRFVAEVASQVGNVVLELQGPMLSLANDLPENVKVIKRGETVPEFEYWSEFFSLPGLLEIGKHDIPAPAAFSYQPSLEVKRAIAESSSLQPRALKIGMVWSGNPGNSLNGIRACGLEHLEPLLDLNGCRFFSLQVGGPAGEIKQRGLESQIVDLAPLLHDFAATATAIESLDLVITTDTSVPHLAGSLGAETWLMLHRPADWRWGQLGDHCPWYPSLRLFRQEKMRDWKPVVDSVRGALKQRLQAH